MSQNASRNLPGPKPTGSKTQQPNTKATLTTETDKKQISNTNQKEKESLKPTSEQVRLASLLGNRNDDPEINKKIKQVAEFYPNKTTDEISMVLHENDYDLERALNFLADGGDVTHDWVTAGNKTSSKTKSNQDESGEAQHQNKGQPVEHQNSDENKNKKFNKKRPQNRTQNEDKNKFKDQERSFKTKPNIENQSSEEQNLDEKFSNLELGKESDSQSNQQQSTDYNRRGNYNRGNYQNSPRGGFRMNRGGASNRGMSNRSRGSMNRRTDRRPQKNEFVNSNDMNNLNQSDNLNKTSENEQNTSDLVPNQNETNKIKSRNDNLRDIGTWSNDQIGKRRQNRYQNGNTQNGTKNQVQIEEWDDMNEEWQGDLTKTQIFTSSTQKKDVQNQHESAQTQVVQQPVQQQQDFPIGHFNAEEATQNIKKAVGIGSTPSVPSSTSQPSTTVNTTTTTNVPQSSNKTSNENTNDQQKSIKQNIKFPLPSKPLPPPSTKIPKSAVIMPDGSTNYSSSFNLDVQFGVDLETPLVELKENKIQAQTQSVVSQPTLPVQTQTQAQNKVNINSNLVQPVKPNLSQQQQQQQQQQQHQQQAQKTNFNQPHTNLNLKQQQFLNQLQSNSVQNQQQPAQQVPQPQRNQYQNKDTTPNQLLNNLSPQNSQKPTSNQQQILGQLQQNNQAQNKPPTTPASSAASITPTGPNAMAPPPGVSLMNPNNQYLISLPFVGFDNQNFPYFDQSQIDNSLIQVYSQLANVPPPGVATPGTASAPQYPISDSKFPRTDSANSNTQLNTNTAAAALAQQQQPPINLIPNLNNFPFFFHNYGYPNLYHLPIPNGTPTPTQPGAPTPQQFQNKPPQGYPANFPNAQTYEEQSKDQYNNYQQQQQQQQQTNPNTATSQMKTSSSNLSDMANYQKNVDKTQPAGYHTPPPTNFPGLLNQQQLPNLNANQPGPAHIAYITSMMGAAGANPNMVHPNIQDNLARNVGNNPSLKQLPQKANYPNATTWNQ